MLSRSKQPMWNSAVKKYVVLDKRFVVALGTVLLVLIMWQTAKANPKWQVSIFSETNDATDSLNYFVHEPLSRSSLYQSAVNTLLGGNDPFDNLQKMLMNTLNDSGQDSKNLNGIPLRMDDTFQYSADPQWLLEAVLDQGYTITVILEVGSYKGQSTSKLATMMKRYESEDIYEHLFLLLCLDTWLGSVLFWERKGDFLMLAADGRPRLYEQFLLNVASCGHADVVLPITTSSLVGLRYLSRVMHPLGSAPAVPPPDFIFLDSSHEANETSAELEESFRLLRPGGYLSGHDFTPSKWPVVVEAVLRFVRAHLTHLEVLDVREWRRAYRAGDCDLVHPEVARDSESDQEVCTRMLICKKCITCRENGLWILQKR